MSEKKPTEGAAVSLDSWGLTTPETLEACRERTKNGSRVSSPWLVKYTKS